MPVEIRIVQEIGSLRKINPFKEAKMGLRSPIKERKVAVKRLSRKPYRL